MLSQTAVLAETQQALTFPFSPTYVPHPHHLFPAQEQEMPSETRQLHDNRARLHRVKKGRGDASEIPRITKSCFFAEVYLLLTQSSGGGEYKARIKTNGLSLGLSSPVLHGFGQVARHKVGCQAEICRGAQLLDLCWSDKSCFAPAKTEF